MRKLMNKEQPVTAKATSDLDAFGRDVAERVPAFRDALELSERSDRFCEHVREQLRSARKASGLTQAELAEAMEVTQSAISKIENGDADLSLKTIFRCADALGLQPYIVMAPSIGALFSDAQMEALEPAIAASVECNLVSVQQSLFQKMGSYSSDVLRNSISASLSALKGL